MLLEILKAMLNWPCMNSEILLQSTYNHLCIESCTFLFFIGVVCTLTMWCFPSSYAWNTFTHGIFIGLTSLNGVIFMQMFNEFPLGLANFLCLYLVSWDTNEGLEVDSTKVPITMTTHQKFIFYKTLRLESKLLFKTSKALMQLKN